MDKEQEELQFLGFFGIWRESFKIIHKWSEIFIQLGLALTLPLSFIYLAHTEISYLLAQNISLTASTLAISVADKSTYEATSRALSRELAGYLLFEVAYIAFLFVFSLLSTSAIVYTVACVYSGKKVNFKDVMRVILKVWKRLMVTLLSVMAIMFVYNFVFAFVGVIIYLTYPMDTNNMNSMMKLLFIGLAVSIVYLVGVCYMGVIWQLANTISVLEESYGFQALRKSKILMKGKMGISVAIFLVSNLCVGVVLHLYNSYVVIDRSHGGMINRVGFGIITLFVLCILLLLGLVVHTVFYLVCKSYHHEQIDKTALADHLEVYHGEGYVLLKPKDIQLMEQV